jgi:PhnB protein
MQVGILAQITDGDQVLGNVRRLLAATRSRGVRIVFLRHYFMPTALAGVYQLRQAKIWQRQARGAEVMAYYKYIFGGSLNAMKYGDIPMDLPFNPPTGALAHAHLDSDRVQISGGDAMGDEPDESLESSTYSFLLDIDSIEEAAALIQKFTSTGGQVAMPFDKAPWGDHYGQVKDKYGVLWAFSVASANA